MLGVYLTDSVLNPIYAQYMMKISDSTWNKLWDNVRSRVDKVVNNRISYCGWSMFFCYLATY